MNYVSRKKSVPTILFVAWLQNNSTQFCQCLINRHILPHTDQQFDFYLDANKMTYNTPGSQEKPAEKKKISNSLKHLQY
jgi:hypothetical protein